MNSQYLPELQTSEQELEREGPPAESDDPF